MFNVARAVRGIDQCIQLPCSKTWLQEPSFFRLQQRESKFPTPPALRELPLRILDWDHHGSPEAAGLSSASVKLSWLFYWLLASVKRAEDLERHIKSVQKNSAFADPAILNSRSFKCPVCHWCCSGLIPNNTIGRQDIWTIEKPARRRTPSDDWRLTTVSLYDSLPSPWGGHKKLNDLIKDTLVIIFTS